MDDYLDMFVFDVFYKDWDGSTDYARFNAEDEAHARDIFALYYPRVEIVEVVDRGAAF